MTAQSVADIPGREPGDRPAYPWIVRSTAMVNHYYVYAVDRDFGAFFLKFCTYFPFNAKLCLNGHECGEEVDHGPHGLEAGVTAGFAFGALPSTIQRHPRPQADQPSCPQCLLGGAPTACAAKTTT
jgi:hypothetical protein